MCHSACSCRVSAGFGKPRRSSVFSAIDSRRCWVKKENSAHPENPQFHFGTIRAAARGRNPEGGQEISGAAALSGCAVSPAGTPTQNPCLKRRPSHAVHTTPNLQERRNKTRLRTQPRSLPLAGAPERRSITGHRADARPRTRDQSGIRYGHVIQIDPTFP